MDSDTKSEILVKIEKMKSMLYATFIFKTTPKKVTETIEKIISELDEIKELIKA